MLNHLILAIGIFCLTYLAIISDKLNRTAVAMTGAFLMLILNVEGQSQAFKHIDANTIGLLIGMMIIVNIIKRSGFFQFLALWAARKAKGDPWKILLYFSIITALSSALLDNVTTILLIVPVTLVITDTLEISPIPFMVPLIMIANIGGTATLIGDPPNIMIGSAAGLGFNDFLFALGPVVLMIFGVTLYALKHIFRDSFHCSESKKEKILAMDERQAIRDKPLMMKSLIIMSLTVVGFILHQFLGYESATIALFGASVLLLISRVDVEDVLMEIEWTTIFFFISLFILVGALEEVGVMRYLASGLLQMTEGRPIVTLFFVLWISAIFSSFLDNIPFVATMIPLIQNLGTMSELPLTPLWWALALGACLGGNGTLVGASANVLVSGMLSKRGHKLSFLSYMKVGFPLMLGSIVIASIYLAIFFV